MAPKLMQSARTRYPCSCPTTMTQLGMSSSSPSSCSCTTLTTTRRPEKNEREYIRMIFRHFQQRHAREADTSTLITHPPSASGEAPRVSGHGSPSSPRWHICSYLARFILIFTLSIVSMSVLAGRQGVFAQEAHIHTEGISLGQTSLATIAQVNRIAAFSESATLSHVHTGKIQAVGTQAADICLPLDIPCILHQAAQWVADGILSALQPLMDGITTSSLNFLTQTPVDGGDGLFQNALVLQLVRWAIGAVDAAVALFLVIGGYNIMISRHIGVRSDEIMEVLTRLVLAVLAANLGLPFVRLFIELENALCLDVVHLAGRTMLTNVITGLFHGDLMGAGFIAFVLAIILGVMMLLLAWQMLVRLALLLLLIVLYPFAMLCSALRQTQGWTRLWLSVFGTTVFVQFFQVILLALGGMLISFVAAANLLQMNSTILSLLTSSAILYLVLRIPRMLQNYALRPIAEAGTMTLNAAQGAAEYVGTTAIRLMSLF